jgi:hypothetical protein
MEVFMSLSPAILKDFWTYLSEFEWWQGLIIIIAMGLMLIISGYGKKVVEKIKETVKPKKLKCEVCIKMVLMKSIMIQTKMGYISNNVLKDQMNIVEQKISEMKTILINTYSEELNKSRLIEKNNQYLYDETIQYKLYLGLINDALFLVKDELRRALKENGFHEKSGLEFSAYVKDKVKHIVYLIEQHMRNLYPMMGMIVSLEKELENINKNIYKIEDILFELFSDAKSIKTGADLKLQACEGELLRFINKDLNIPLSDTSRISIESYRTSV